jgi:hypothetical protein
MVRRDGDDDDDDDDNRITRSLAGVAVILFLAVACLLLVRELRTVSNFQDCVMSGRSNCAPIEPAER